MTTPVYDSVTYLAADRLAVSNAAGDSFVSEFAPGARLRTDCGTDGVLLGTVAASSFDAATGRTMVTTAMDGGAALTANLVAVLHGNDLPESLCAHAALHAIGGRDALPGATTGVSGLVSLAGAAETQAGTSAAKAVTPAGLAASAKGLIATNTTIYVATTGSDTTGTGALGAPYASIAKALASITGKLIASGVIVTIQVADGTYAVGSTIVIDHPDADKIQILGNTSAETTVAISSIDTTAKTINVPGDYTASINAGDIIGLVGSSTSGLNGAYVVSGITYTGGNTVVSCSTETLASSVVGGGSIKINYANRCKLSCSPGVSFMITKTALGILSGFRIDSPDTTAFSGIRVTEKAKATIGRVIIVGFSNSFLIDSQSYASFYQPGIIAKGSGNGIYGLSGSYIVVQSWAFVIFSQLICGVNISDGTQCRANDDYIAIDRCTIPFSPAANTVGNNNSLIIS